MKLNPKVSVVIPTFNRREYVAQAVESVLQQSLEDIEVIVVDDGSTDDTPERLQEFGRRIHYVRTRNQGAARARNVGMQISRGRYIAYLDSDDVYLRFKSELQATLLDHCPEIGLVYSEASAFDDSGYYEEWHLKAFHSSAYQRGITYENLFSRQISLEETSFAFKVPEDSPREWMTRSVYFGRIFDAYLINTVVFTPTIMFRRDMLSRIGYQDARFGLFHDLEFVLRICKQHPVAFIDIPTYKIRYHPGQISTTKGSRGARNAIQKQRDLLHVLRVHGLRNLEYYRQNRQVVDRQLAVLHRAVAIPLLSFSGGSSHQDKYYPKRARKYLHRCATLGKPQWFLWLLSFCPHFWRRLGFVTIRMRQQLTKALKRRLSHRDYR